MTQAPIAGVQVRVGPHRASTDESGFARIAVPAGEHVLSTWKAGYDALDTAVRVPGSEELLIEITARPEEDPFAFWRG